MTLLSTAQLPAGFGYPPDFLRLVDLEIVHIDPWHMLGGELLQVRSRGLMVRYPDRHLVPFARRQDNDDIACWEMVDGLCQVVVVHDFSSPGWEQRERFDDFASWLRSAFDDLICYIQLESN